MKDHDDYVHQEDEEYFEELERKREIAEEDRWIGLKESKTL